jgi:hypothetical protein
VPRDGSVIVEVYPLGLLVMPVANRDVEVGNLSVVEGEALWGYVEGLLLVVTIRNHAYQKLFSFIVTCPSSLLSLPLTRIYDRHVVKLHNV